MGLNTDKKSETNGSMGGPAESNTLGNSLKIIGNVM